MADNPGSAVPEINKASAIRPDLRLRGGAVDYGSLVQLAERILRHIDDCSAAGDDKITMTFSAEDVRFLRSLVVRSAGGMYGTTAASQEKEESALETRRRIWSHVLKLRKFFFRVDVCFNECVFEVDALEGRERPGGILSAVSNALFRPARKTMGVLNGCSGVIEAGRPCLILGPPGAGKSSLMHLLAGLNSPQRHESRSGLVTYSGYEAEDLVMTKVAGMVEQDDDHIPTLTVQETLEFAHNCCGQYRSDGAANDEDAEKLFHVYDELGGFPAALAGIFGLEKCRNTIVGNRFIRGVSGGERRRVTCTEVISGKRPFYCLDEISTGLDSAATYDVAKALCEASGTLSLTVAISLLQPPPETFALFPEVMVMAQGYIVYHGPRDDVLDYFASIGYLCPSSKDIADFLVEVVTPLGLSFAAQDPERGGGPCPRTAEEFARAWRESTYFKPMEAKIQEHLTRRKTYQSTKRDENDEGGACGAPLLGEGDFVVPYARDSGTFQQTWSQTMWLVFVRQRALVVRNKGYLKSRVFMAILNGLIAGSLFWHISTTPSTTSVSWYTYRFGLIFWLSLQTNLLNLPQIPLTFMERPSFYRQRARNYFRTSNWVLAFTVTQIPIAMVDTTLLVTLVYWMSSMINPADTPSSIAIWLFFCLACIVSQTAVASICRLFVAITPNASIGMALTGVYLAFSILFCGFTITANNIPGWYIWIYWINPLAWLVRALAVATFTVGPFSDISVGSQEANAGKHALEVFGFKTETYWMWISLGVLVMQWVVFTIAFGVALHYLRFRGRMSATVAAKDTDTRDDAEKTVGTGSFKPVTLVFRNLSYSVPSPYEKDGTIRLLNGVTGFARPGTLTALMGSSGAGKTTLMDVIAGRKTSGVITGEILVNGREKDEESFLRTVGYVEQLDIHSPHATVREAVSFSAALRCAKPFQSNAELDRYTESVLRSVGMQGPIANKEIGTRGAGGLSTEQAKRLTIAVELAANPAVMFLDEPTSALDARAAQLVMLAIKNVAMSEPSRALFENFDHLLLLQRGGETVFFGELGEHSSNLLEYLYSIDGVVRMKERYNPATYMLEVIGAGTDDVGHGRLDFALEYRSSVLCAKNTELVGAIITDDNSKNEAPISEGTQSRSVGQQFVVLTKKFYKTYWRSVGYSLTRMALSVVLALVYGSSLTDSKNISTTAQLHSFVGIIYASTLFLGVLNQIMILPLMFDERNVFYREKASRYYKSWVYALVTPLVEVPYLVFNSLLFVATFYFLFNLRTGVAHFFYYWFIFFLYTWVHTSLGSLLVALVPNQGVAQIVGGFFINLWSIFCGFQIAYPGIPKPWIFMYYLSPTSYVLSGMVVDQMYCDSCTVVNAPQSVESALCEAPGENGVVQSCAEICGQSAPGCRLVTYGETIVTSWDFLSSEFGFRYDMRLPNLGILVAFVAVLQMSTIWCYTSLAWNKR